MEEKIKEIVSVFIRVPTGNIGPSTPVDRSAVQNSILLHRMYARLAEEGFAFENYSTIKVFGELLKPFTSFRADSPEATTTAASAGPRAVASSLSSHSGSIVPWETAPRTDLLSTYSGPRAPQGDQAIVGIDMEAVANLPRVSDFRTAEFYRMNFSPEETAYCILQVDPYASFAGLFAAKEAIVKADEQYRTRPFHTLAIGHSDQGKPLYPGFSLSISHANEMAVAVAVKNGGAMFQPPAPAASLSPKPGKKAGSTTAITWLALLLALAALLVTLLR